MNYLKKFNETFFSFISPKKRKVVIDLTTIDNFSYDDKIRKIKNILFEHELGNKRDIRFDFMMKITEPVINGLINDFFKKIDWESLNYEKLCRLVFLRKPRKFKNKFIVKNKCNLSSDDISKLLLPYVNCKSKIPVLLHHKIKFLICKLYNTVYSNNKRKIEIENMENFDYRQIFIEMKKVLIPADVILHILRFVKKTNTNCDRITVLNEGFYLLFLMSWDKIILKISNFYSIPIIVLNYCKTIKLSTKGLCKEDFNYFYRNAMRFETLDLNIFNEFKIKFIVFRKFYSENNYKNIKFFEYLNQIKVIYPLCKKLKVQNLHGIKINREVFPNVKKFTFYEYKTDFYEIKIGTKKYKKRLKIYKSKNNILLNLHECQIEKETREFLKGLDRVKIGIGLISCNTTAIFDVFKNIKQMDLYIRRFQYEELNHLAGFMNLKTLKIYYNKWGKKRGIEKEWIELIGRDLSIISKFKNLDVLKIYIIGNNLINYELDKKKIIRIIINCGIKLIIYKGNYIIKSNMSYFSPETGTIKSEKNWYRFKSYKKGLIYFTEFVKMGN